MANGVKLLVSAFEASGKSTITSQLTEALVFNMDQKDYGFSVPHVNIMDYTGINDLLELITEKIEAYNDKFGKYPKTIVFDTVTQMYSAMQRYNGTKYSGFDEHKANNADTLAFNGFIEESLIPSGINVVIVAHTIFDETTNRFIIPASGAFAKAGSWLSVVNNGIFLEKKGNKIIVHTSGLKVPARTTLKDLPVTEDATKYSLQEHLDKLVANKFEAEDYQL